MAFEIERKFLVESDSYMSDVESSSEFEQAYISTDKDKVVRLRIIDNRLAKLTIKGITRGFTRHEWEYDIPVHDAREMMDNLPVSSHIIKTRYRIGPWEIDRFHGALEGLTVAEIELPSAETPLEPLPQWIGREVTGDPAYYNSTLAQRCD